MRLVFALLLLFSTELFGQNLVPNPGFELSLDTIDGFTYDHLAFTRNVRFWTTPNTASPDLITPAFEEGYIANPGPRSGRMMIGIQTTVSWAECVGVRLTEPLVPNRTYHVQYWIRRATSPNPQLDMDRSMNSNFGARFSVDSIKTNSGIMLAGLPQAPANSSIVLTDQEWVQVSNYFTAREAYEYMYLGQFRINGVRPEILKGYYFIDDVSVEILTDYEAFDQSIALPAGTIIPLSNVNFISGSTQLSDQKSYEVIDELSSYLQANPTLRICINGHTDDVGNERSNMSLSRKRARAIVQRVVENGISKNRIEWKGYGEVSPIADNKTATGRAENRRVEFEVVE